MRPASPLASRVVHLPDLPTGGGARAKVLPSIRAWRSITRSATAWAARWIGVGFVPPAIEASSASRMRSGFATSVFAEKSRSVTGRPSVFLKSTSSARMTRRVFQSSGSSQRVSNAERASVREPSVPSLRVPRRPFRARTCSWAKARSGLRRPPSCTGKSRSNEGLGCGAPNAAGTTSAEARRRERRFMALLLGLAGGRGRCAARAR